MQFPQLVGEEQALLLLRVAWAELTQELGFASPQCSYSVQHSPLWLPIEASLGDTVWNLPPPQAAKPGRMGWVSPEWHSDLCKAALSRAGPKVAAVLRRGIQQDWAS